MTRRLPERVPDWRARLHAFLAENEGRRFQWGRWDCFVGMASGAVLAITGHDMARGYRGRYRGLKGGQTIARRRDGVETAEALMNKRLGRRRHPAFARTGDIVCCNGCLGVMEGDHGVFIGSYLMGDRYTHDGLVRVPRADLEGCWHV